MKTRKRIAAALCAVLVTASCLSPLSAAANDEGTLLMSDVSAFADSNIKADSAVEDVVEINEANFPDDTFRKYISDNFDTDGSGGLSQTDIDNITEIDVAGDSNKPNTIADLTGIEYFTKLEKLKCGWNQLTSLDLSKNTALKELNCEGNKLTSLDFSKNSRLNWLICYGNQLTSLNISNNAALKILNCEGNKFTILDVSKNTALYSLLCNDNQLTNLDVGNNTALAFLECYNNKLTSLDVSKNTALNSLGCGGNQLISLDVSNNKLLQGLYCSDNQLTSLDVSKNTALKYLYCRGNQLTSLDVSKNTALTELHCNDNQLTSLDISKNTALKELGCGSNQLTSLDVSNNTALKKLICDKNQLTSLDVSKNTNLEEFTCTENTYSIGDVKGSYSLSNLPKGFDPAKADNWTGADYDKTAKSLSNFTSNTVAYTYDCGNGKSATFKLVANSVDPNVVDINETNFPDETFREYVKQFDTDGSGGFSQAELDSVIAIDVSGTEEKPNTIANLTGIEHFTKLTILFCPYNQLTSLDVSKNTNLNLLYCFNNELSTLNLSTNANLTDLWCSNNKLTSLDVSSNTELKVLWCNYNQLTNLNLINNKKLCNLQCGFNQLTKLDLSQNSQLEGLTCRNNQLKSLDVSNNTLLTGLDCAENQITSLDVSKNTALIGLHVGGNNLTSLDLSNQQLEYFTFADNAYSIGDVNDSYPLSNLPKGFDPAKAYEWTGATYDKATNSLKNFTSKTVTYKYDCGNGKSATFTLTASSISASPTKPTFTSVTAGVESVSLKWNAVEGATSYRVFYRLNGTSKWTYKNTASTAMTVTGLTGGKKYDFLVRSYDGSAWSSYTASDIKTATPKAVSKPSFTSLTPGVNSVVLRWNAVSGAKSYRVFYRINGTSKWTYKNTTKNAMNLTGLTGGKKYDFLVRSYNGSAWSTYVASDIKTATPKAASKPVIYSAVPGVNSAVLRWNAVDGAKSYRVYYRISGTSKWYYKNTTKNAMNLTGLTGGKTYEFVVRAYNGSAWTAFTSADIVKAAIKS